MTETKNERKSKEAKSNSIPTYEIVTGKVRETKSDSKALTEVVKTKYTCVDCGKICITANGLKLHRIRLHATTVAQKYSKNMKDLSCHAKKKNDSNENVKKAFDTHVRMAQQPPEEEFLCLHCDSPFLDRNNFRKHMRKVHGEIV